MLTSSTTTSQVAPKSLVESGPDGEPSASQAKGGDGVPFGRGESRQAVKLDSCWRPFAIRVPARRGGFGAKRCVSLGLAVVTSDYGRRLSKQLRGCLTRP
jgi:hypothetical protein